VRTSFRDPSDGGVTGTTLVDKMRERLEKHYRGAGCDIDVVVVIDDADCRFLREGALDLATWAKEMEQQVRAWTERPKLRFVPLLASPEIEAWLLADWQEGFGKEYGPDMLRRVRPDRIADVCRQLFLPAMIELRALAELASKATSKE
jgi:hypothetical protein